MLKRLRGSARSVARLLSSPPALLLYHRVCRPAFDPWGIAISPEDFAAQMSWLARYRRPMSMADFVECLDQGRMPRGAVGVTFDDGYVDNLLYAKPILKKYRIPATLFVATGFVTSGGRFWWDRLSDALLRSVGAVDWTLNAGTERIKIRWDEDVRPDPYWRAWQPAPGVREATFLTIWTILQRLPAVARDIAVREIEARHPAPMDSEARAMTEHELSQMIDGGLITLGAHTVTHPALTTVGDLDLRWELKESRDVCSRLQGRTIAGFAYPYGDMSAGVRSATLAAGFQWACSTECKPAPLKPSPEQRLALPRLVPPSAGAPALARVLRAL